MLYPCLCKTILIVLYMYECRSLKRNKRNHELVEALVATIDQIARDICLSYGHEIGYEMNQCVSYPILNPFNQYNEFGKSLI